MVKCGIAGLLAISFLCAPAMAQEPGDHGGKDRGAMHQRFCSDRYARVVGHLAYLEARLNLTEQQKAAWSKWRQAKIDAADKRRASCLERDWSKDGQESALDREARMERWLSARLQDLQASRPALQALYEGLSPEQKLIFDETSRWHGGPRPGEGPGGRWRGWNDQGRQDPGRE